MSAFLVAVASVFCFTLVFLISGIVRTSQQAINTSRQGLAALTSNSLNDDEKEKAVQQAGLKLLATALSIALRFAVVLGATYVPIFLADYFQWVSTENTLATLISWPFIVGSSLVVIGIIWLANKFKKPTTAAAEQTASYSAAEQIVHMVAFTPWLQKALMHLDSRLFTRREQSMAAPKLIFVTSLARGGTTACLNALASLPGVATTTYRDMPFVTAPFLWSKISSLMHRKTESRERAHGDGLAIDLNSPEAFDEVYWKLLWPEHYQKDHIQLWDGSDHDASSVAKLQTAFKKFSYQPNSSKHTYVSKNNANIARLRYLHQAFNDAAVIIPLRRPAPHAASLLRQHLNFLQQQADDDFTRRYMEDIGHFEFGRAHRPLLFGTETTKTYAATEPDYWLAYWISAFTYVLQCQDLIASGFIHIVTQDDLRSNANHALAAVFAESSNNPELLAELSNHDLSSFFLQQKDVTDETVFNSALLQQANTLYAQLVSLTAPAPTLEATV